MAMKPSQVTEKPNLREKLGKWAGCCYIVSNVGLIFKGVIDDAIAAQPIDLSSIVQDPVALGIGALFTWTAYELAKHGDDNRKTGIALGVATAGSVALTAYTAAQGLGPVSVIGGAWITVATAHGAYQAYKREKQAGHASPEITETDIAAKPIKKKKNKILSLFSDNAKAITEKYPFLVFGISEMISNAAIGYGAWNAKAYTLTAISALWTLGGAFMTAALPSVKERKLPQPA